MSDSVSREKNDVLKLHPCRGSSLKFAMVLGSARRPISSRMEADEEMRGVFVGTDRRMKGEPLDEVVNKMRPSGFQAAAVEVRAT